MKAAVERFGRFFYETRLAKGMTVEQLAEASKVPPTYIRHWENGNGEPTLRAAIAIANALHVTLDNLVSK